MKNVKHTVEFDQVTTRGGDSGESSLYTGDRYRKDDLLFDALGNVDELSSFIGSVRTSSRDRMPDAQLRAIQQKLITVGGEIATPNDKPMYKTIDHITENDVETLEVWEKDLLRDTQIESSFVLPGDSHASAAAHVARSVCRRAERSVVACVRVREMSHLIPAQTYLNRLSDYLFILARFLENGEAA